MPIRFSHSLPIVPSRSSDERCGVWPNVGATTLGLGGICGIGGGGGVGVARRSASSRETVIVGCSAGALVIGGGGGGAGAANVPEIKGGSVLRSEERRVG